MANSSFWYLEPSQFLLCFSGNQVCRYTLRKVLTQVAAATNITCEASSPRVTAQRQLDSMPPLSPNSILKGQSELLPSVKRRAEQQSVSPSGERGTRTYYTHAWAHLWAACPGWEIQMNNCVSSSRCVTFTTQGKNNKPTIPRFLSLCTKQFGEPVHQMQPIPRINPVKLMKVNDKAQISACSRTFTLDNPLKTQCASEHILQRSNNFSRILIILIIPYHLPCGDSYQWMKNNCEVRTTPGSRGNKLLHTPESLAQNIWERTKCLRMQSIIKIPPKKESTHTHLFKACLGEKKR